MLRWSQRVIDLADGDPSKGNFIIGSPLAAAFTMRAIARYCLGRPGWRDDLRHGLAMARSADPMSYANVVAWVYLVGIPFGVLRPTIRAVRESEDALQNAERCGDDFALAQARVTLGMALVHRHTAAERGRGQQLLAEVSEMFLRTGQALGECTARRCLLGAGEGSAWRSRRGHTAHARRRRPSVPRGTAADVWAFPRPVFWWRHCWIAGPTLTWPKPRPRSSG